MICLIVARDEMPLSVTLAVLRDGGGMEGREYVLADPAEEEEHTPAMAARITTSVNRAGHICAINVGAGVSGGGDGGTGGAGQPGSGLRTAVSPSTLKRCIRAGARIGRELATQLDPAIAGTRLGN